MIETRTATAELRQNFRSQIKVELWIGTRTATAELRHNTYDSNAFPVKGSELVLLRRQQSLKDLIEERFENMFSQNSYAYRPGKGHTKAVKYTRFIFQDKKYPYALRMDIDNYFDNIDHHILFERIKHVLPDSEILRLIELSTKMGVVS